MARFGPKLEKRQSVLFRLVDVGAELFAMSATIVRAKQLQKEGDKNAMVLADVFCRGSRRRVHRLFKDTFSNHDTLTYRVAQDVLSGRYAWLERGIIEAPRGSGVSE
ncbi:MAG TPA: hypothetical protein VGD49_12950, partial [Longimicrobiales bacterium]